MQDTFGRNSAGYTGAPLLQLCTHLAAPTPPLALPTSAELLVSIPGYFLWTGKDSRGATISAKQANVSQWELAAQCNATGERGSRAEFTQQVHPFPFLG